MKDSLAPPQAMYLLGDDSPISHYLLPWRARVGVASVLGSFADLGKRRSVHLFTAALKSQWSRLTTKPFFSCMRCLPSREQRMRLPRSFIASERSMTPKR